MAYPIASVEADTELPEACGFCGDELSYPCAFFRLIPDELHRNAVVCSSCEVVIEEFISGLPNDEVVNPHPDGEVYYPPELVENPVETHISDVDSEQLWADLRDADVGDVVEVAAHKPPEGEPATFLEFNARVTRFRKLDGRRTVQLDVESGVSGYAPTGLPDLNECIVFRKGDANGRVAVEGYEYETEYNKTVKSSLGFLVSVSGH